MIKGIKGFLDYTKSEPWLKGLYDFMIILSLNHD